MLTFPSIKNNHNDALVFAKLISHNAAMPQPSKKKLQKFYLTRFSPFRYRNFNIFYTAQTWSLIGNWASDLARSWLVIEMMGKAGALGLVMMAGAIPGLFLYFYGGALADRAQVQKMMITTKLLLSGLVFSLALTLELTELQLWYLIVYAIFEGTLLCFDLPLHTKVLVRLVKRKHFQQALTLSSVNFHSARMLGPMVAGILLATWGPSSVFFFDALSFIIIAYLLSRLKILPEKTTPSQNTQIRFLDLFKDLRRYLHDDRKMIFFITQLLATILILYPVLVVILRTYLKKKFSLDAGEFGLLFSSPAAGSLIGALIMTFAQPKKPHYNLRFSIPMVTITLITITLLNIKWMAAVALFFTGIFTYLTFASLTLSIHLHVQDEFRGRIGSLIAMGFTSIGPLITFPIGLMADNIGYDLSVYILLGIYSVISSAITLIYLKYKPPPNSSL